MNLANNIIYNYGIYPELLWLTHFPGQNDRHFADDSFQYIFLNDNG